MIVREIHLRKLQKGESQLNKHIVEMLIDFQTMWVNPKINQSTYGNKCPIDKDTLHYVTKCMAIKYKLREGQLYNELQEDSGSFKHKEIE